MKSSVPPEILEDSFRKAGKIVKIETGFPGFAFVEYQEEDDADKACKMFNKEVIPNVGEVRCSRATQRGYEEAVNKRQAYWKGRGHDGDPSDWKKLQRHQRRSSRSRSGGGFRPRPLRRSPSVMRQMPRGRRSRSFSQGGRSHGQRSSCGNSRSPSRRSDSSLRSRMRRRSASRESRRSRNPPSRSRSGSKVPTRPWRQNVQNGVSNSHATTSALAAPRAEAVPAQPVAAATSSNQDSTAGAGVTAVVPMEEPPMDFGDFALANGGGQLSCADRSSTVCFFDGTSLPEILLEGAAIVKVPDVYMPHLVNGFPHGFQGVSQEAALRLLEVFSCFIDAGSGAGAQEARYGSELSVEVRQAMTIDGRGRRVVRKSLVINKEVVCSEERSIRAAT